LKENAMSAKTKMQFIAWTKSRHPEVFNGALRKLGVPVSGLAGLADINAGASQAEMLSQQDAFGGAFDSSVTATPTTVNSTPSLLDSVIGSLTNMISQVAPVLAGSQQAKTCIQVNAQRATANLPPVDCSTAGLAPQVAIGVSPAVSTIMWAGLGIVAIGMAMAFKRRR
jgi:hypothetical protein